MKFDEDTLKLIDDFKYYTLSSMQIAVIRSIISDEFLNDEPYGCELEYLEEDYRNNTPDFSAPTNTTFDRDWFVDQCENHLKLHDETKVLDQVDFCCDVFSILQSNDNIEAKLVDLMGFLNLEFISALVENRDLIMSNLMAQAPEIEEEAVQPKSKSSRQPISFGAQVTVISQRTKIFKSR